VFLQLVAIGWGVLLEGNQSPSEILKQVTVKSVAASSTYCLNANLLDSDKQMCAGIMPIGGKGKTIENTLL
jgi:hypothetical protein